MITQREALKELLKAYAAEHALRQVWYGDLDDDSAEYKQAEGFTQGLVRAFCILTDTVPLELWHAEKDKFNSK